MKALQCAEFTRKAIQWCAQVGLDQTHTDKIVGNMRVRLAMWVHGKKSKNRIAFQHAQEICELFVCEVVESTPSLANVAAPWARGARKQTNVQENKIGPMRNFGDGNVDEDVLSKLEFVEGGFVCKNDAEFKTIQIKDKKNNYSKCSR